MGRTRVRRRRRIAATMVSVAVAVILSAPVAGALGRQSQPSDADVAPPKRWERVYVVRPGDSVWSIAERTADGGDPRALVDAIAARNGIDAGAVVPGQALVIPSVA